MAKVSIRHKCIMVARNAARKDSDARRTGYALFIKRYYGKYRLLAVRVSEKQRSCRDMFTEAQRLAHKELENWNKKRHWEREARRHKVKGAHRMAVKAFYEMLKEGKEALAEKATEGAKGIRGLKVSSAVIDFGSSRSLHQRYYSRNHLHRLRHGCGLEGVKKTKATVVSDCF